MSSHGGSRGSLTSPCPPTLLWLVSGQLGGVAIGCLCALFVFPIVFLFLPFQVCSVVMTISIGLLSYRSTRKPLSVPETHKQVELPFLALAVSPLASSPCICLLPSSYMTSTAALHLLSNCFVSSADFVSFWLVRVYVYFFPPIMGLFKNFMCLQLGFAYEVVQESWIATFISLPAVAATSFWWFLMFMCFRAL